MLPVIVVGAGPVGQTAALLLARWGIPVTVLDRLPARDTAGSKSICQHRHVLDIWAAAGAADIGREGVHWSTARTFYREQEIETFTFAEPFVNVPQSRVEQILDERIARNPLVEVRWGHEVVGMSQDAEGVTVHGRDTDVRASYVIACGGARGNSLRNSLGLSLRGETCSDRFLVCDVRAEIPARSGERRFYFDPAWNPGRQVLVHSCPDGVFRIDWQVPDAFDLETERNAGRLDARIREVLGDVPYEVSWASVYRFHQRTVDRMRVGRVLVAGDCAHLYLPFGARGLNSGVQDAENAAWKIAFVAHGWAPGRLLESYHGERHAAALENLAVTGGAASFLVPGNERERAHRLRVLGDLAAGIPGGPRPDTGRFSEPYWYVRSPLTTRDPRRPFGGRPPRGAEPVPGPGVLLPDLGLGGGGRLRELARSGLLLLGDGDLTAALRAARDATRAPVAAVRFEDAGPDIATALSAGPGETWLIRPDAYVAAVLRDATPRETAAAVHRALGSGSAAAGIGADAHRLSPSHP